MKPTKDYVLIEVDEQKKEKEIAGIILTQREKPHTRGTVIAVGPDVKTITEGQRVLFSPFYYEEIEERVIAVHEEEVIAILKDV